MVPEMISTKDLSYISDMFDWNFVVSKTLYHFSNEVQDEQIKQELISASKMHETICHNLVEILKGE